MGSQSFAWSVSLCLHVALLWWLALQLEGSAANSMPTTEASRILSARLITLPPPAEVAIPAPTPRQVTPHAQKPKTRAAAPAEPQLAPAVPPTAELPEAVPDTVPTTAVPAVAQDSDPQPTVQASSSARPAETIAIVREPRFRVPPTPPVYPRLSRQRGESGTVLIQARVEIDGSISDIRIVQSSGFGRLDHAALSAVRRWQIEPWRQGDRLLTAWVELPVVFELVDAGRHAWR